jgi:hypothetical protein
MFNAPSASAAAVPQSDYIQPNLGHALRIWWAYYWPTTLIATIISVILNVLLRALYQTSSAPGHWILWAIRLQSYIVTFAVAIFVIDYILQKQFRHFRIVLQATTVGSGAQEVPVNLRRSLRVWWTFTWRTLIGGAIGFIAIILPLGMFFSVFRPGPIASTIFGSFLGLCVGASVSLYVIYSSILDEDFGDFRVCLMPRKSAEPVASAATPAASHSLPQ